MTHSEGEDSDSSDSNKKKEKKYYYVLTCSVDSFAFSPHYVIVVDFTSTLKSYEI